MLNKNSKLDNTWKLIVFSVHLKYKTGNSLQNRLLEKQQMLIKHLKHHITTVGHTYVNIFF